MNQENEAVVTGSRNLTPLIRAILDEKTEVLTTLRFYGVENEGRYGYPHREVVRCAVRMSDIVNMLPVKTTTQNVIMAMHHVYGWERVAPCRRFGILARWWMRIDRDEEMVDENDHPLGLIPANRFEPWPV